MRSLAPCFAVLAVVLLSACPAKKCNAASCATGCCDAVGTCVVNTSTNQCGTAGNQCTACPLGQTCVAGACSIVSNTGGGGGQGGGGGGGGGGGTDRQTLRAAFHALAAADCERKIHCGSHVQAELAACTQMNEVTFHSYFCRDIDALCDRLSIDGASACAAALQRATDCTSSVPECADLLGTLGGVVPTGGTCSQYAEECANQSDTCGLTCPRTCQPVATGGSRQPCGRNGTCNSGFFCDVGVCTAVRANGSTCVQSRECSSGACESSRCVPLPAIGQTCRSLYPYCQEGAYCATGTCAALVSAGGRCPSFDACASGLVCDQGFCRARAGVGDRCSPSADLCGLNLNCDSILRSCQESVTVAVGASCGGVRWCVNGAACLDDRENADGGVGTLGTCTIKRATGPCDVTEDCAVNTSCIQGSCASPPVGTPCNGSGTCAANQYCGSSVRNCVPRFASGAACEEGTLSCLVGSEVCVPSATDSTSRCRARVAPGAACAVDEGCQVGSLCRNGHCQMLGHLGEACFNETCFGGNCVDGGCVAPSDAGVACRYSEGCKSGQCLNARCADPTCP